MLLLMLVCIFGLRQVASMPLLGLDRLQRGVDIISLDLLPLNPRVDQGFKHPVIEYNFTQNKTWQNPSNGIVYEIPDDVRVTHLPTGSKDSHVLFYKSSASIHQSMATHVNVHLRAGMFSASASAVHMSKTMNEKSKYIAEISTYHSAYQVDLSPYWTVQLDRHAKDYVDNRLTEDYHRNPGVFVGFIQHFGTHYFARGRFGALIRDYIEIDSHLLDILSERDIKINAKINFGTILKINGGTSNKKTAVNKQFKQRTHHYIKYYGGKVDFSNPDQTQRWKQWERSVATNPWLFGGRLVPITNLIENRYKKEALEMAIQEYMDRASLNETERFYKVLLSKTSNVRIRDRIKQLLLKIHKLKSLPLGRLRPFDLIGMRSLVESHDWFLDNAQFCFHWYNFAHTVQCGAPNNFLCAGVNSMTHYYRDDTHDPPGGCMMQWGLFSRGHVLGNFWFYQLSICFKFYAEFSRSKAQCGEGKAENHCVSAGGFTPRYLDDTDNRDGGCFMSWMLSVPEHAPAWLHSAKLCFQWFPDGDPRQCQRGKRDKICAVANRWTDYYRDDTHSIPGGCQMRWGIYSDWLAYRPIKSNPGSTYTYIVGE